MAQECANFISVWTAECIGFPKPPHRTRGTSSSMRRCWMHCLMVWIFPKGRSQGAVARACTEAFAYEVVDKSASLQVERCSRARRRVRVTTDTRARARDACASYAE